MSNVVLSDELLKLYFGFTRSGKVTKDESGNNITKITKLLACIKEFYTNKEQLARCGVTDEMMTAVESMPLFNLDNTTTELKDLVLKSKLKLLLVDKNCSHTDVISYNILTPNPRYGFHYSMTFKAGEDKSFAISHIQRLITNSPKIEIIDPYFIYDSNQCTENLNLLNQFITNKTNKLEITCGSSNNSINLKSQLADSGYTNTSCPQILANTHDRYIKANGVKIHLSSGFYALTQRNKELTYMVEIL
ncbi:MAG: hypothetical protein K2X04_11235 [Burkholderiales bacterium]|jgi:hypothetical protein|nr:hypothetical protein [Burkholderiales bacterium]